MRVDNEFYETQTYKPRKMVIDLKTEEDYDNFQAILGIAKENVDKIEKDLGLDGEGKRLSSAIFSLISAMLPKKA